MASHVSDTWQAMCHNAASHVSTCMEWEFCINGRSQTVRRRRKGKQERKREKEERRESERRKEREKKERKGKERKEKGEKKERTSRFSSNRRRFDKQNSSDRSSKR